MRSAKGSILFLRERRIAQLAFANREDFDLAGDLGASSQLRIDCGHRRIDGMIVEHWGERAKTAV
jgi:hypothetical protein